MTTDNRTNEPTEAQVEAAGVAFNTFERNYLDLTPLEKHHSRIRAALVAAASVVPQAESVPGKRLSPEFRADLVEAARDRIQAVWDDVPEGVDAETMAQNVVSAQEFFWLTHAFPAVQHVSESDALALVEDVIAIHADRIGTHYEECYKYHVACLAVAVKRRLAGEGR